MGMSILHRVEDVHDHHVARYVTLSFDTKYRGIWQCKYGSSGITEFASEPPFETLTKEEQEEVEKVGAIVWRMLFPEANHNL